MVRCAPGHAQLIDPGYRVTLFRFRRQYDDQVDTNIDKVKCSDYCNKQKQPQDDRHNNSGRVVDTYL